MARSRKKAISFGGGSVLCQTLLDFEAGHSRCLRGDVNYRLVLGSALLREPDSSSEVIHIGDECQKGCFLPACLPLGLAPPMCLGNYQEP